jgi:hypothetical protein
MSTLKVDGIRSNSASSDAITLASDGTCTANLTNRTNRRLTINGDFRIAQRGTSSTSNGIQTVDRFGLGATGTDEAPTQAQVDVSSGTTPYTLGFRKALKVTNGNQTGGAGAADKIIIYSNYEAQDIANSGWNYVSASSYLTLSFWVKSSVAQNFYFRLETSDGTAQNYPMETGSLTADTWTKITKTIPGNSNLQFDNNIHQGLAIEWVLFRGTDQTGSTSLNTWATYSDATRSPDNTATWYTTNDATFEITGVQLEVSDHATSFEHRSFGQELALCQRYFYNVLDYNDGGNNDADNNPVCEGTYYDSSNFYAHFTFPVSMRAVPTFVETSGVSNAYRIYRGGGTNSFDSFNNGIWVGSTKGAILQASTGISGTAGYSAFIKSSHSSVTYTAFSAEL